MKLGPSRQIAPTHCIECAALLDGSTGVDTDDAPTPGSAIVCIYCGTLQMYDEGMQLRAPNDEEIRDLAGDARILAIQDARAEALRVKK